MSQKIRTKATEEAGWGDQRNEELAGSTNNIATRSSLLVMIITVLVSIIALLVVLGVAVFEVYKGEHNLWHTVRPLYRLSVRFRAAFYSVLVFILVSCFALGICVQMIVSVVGEDSLTPGHACLTIMIVPFVFNLLSSLANEMVAFAVQALETPSFLEFRVMTSAAFSPSGKLADAVIIIGVDVVPLASLGLHMVLAREPTVSSMLLWYIRGGLWSVVVLVMVEVLSECVLHLRPALAEKLQDIAAELEELLLGQVFYKQTSNKSLGYKHSSSLKTPSERAAQCFMFQAQQQAPCTALAVFISAVVLSLATSSLVYAGYLKPTLVISWVVCSLILVQYSKKGIPQFKARLHITDWILIIMFITLALGLLVFSQSDNMDPHGQVKTAVLRPSPTTKVYTEQSYSNSYPICLLRWGVNTPEALKLSAFDLSIFALAMGNSQDDDIMQVVRNGTQNTDIADVVLESVETNVGRVGRWGVFKLPTSKVRVLAVRGTATKDGLMADGDLYAVIKLMQIFNRLSPILDLVPLEIIQNLCGFSFRRFWGEQRIWEDLVAETLKLKAASVEQGYELVLTGHSLGGTLAVVAGAHAHVPVLAFSAPGQFYLEQRFGINPQDVRESAVNVLPLKDPYAWVDEQLGVQQIIQCKAFGTECHSLSRTVCEMHRSCGDPRGRLMTYHCPVEGNTNQKRES